jgi:hypothetical protein
MIKRHVEKLDNWDFRVLLLIHWQTRSYKTLRNGKTYITNINIPQFHFKAAKKKFLVWNAYIS